MNYYEIGQRIRKIRKAHGMSQEELAEKVNISVTHMSHIETGNTKLSLPVFVSIAAVLEVRTDDLLHDTPSVTVSDLRDELTALFDSCTVQEARCILEIAKTTKNAMNKYL